MVDYLSKEAVGMGINDWHLCKEAVGLGINEACLVFVFRF